MPDDVEEGNAGKRLPIRVVIDASVLIRYLIKPGEAARKLIEDWWLDGKVQMVTAPELVVELADVLERDSIRRLVGPEEGHVLMQAIERYADILAPLGSAPSYTRDRKDDKFVACAIAGNAACVISEDRDLLVLNTLAGVAMMTPYDFLNTFRNESS